MDEQWGDTLWSRRQVSAALYAACSAAFVVLNLLMDDDRLKRQPPHTCPTTLPSIDPNLRPNPQRDIQRGQYLARLYEGSDEVCINMVRMRRAQFFNFCRTLRSRGLLKDTIHVRVEEQVAMFLHTIGHSMRNRVVGLNFQRSGETVSRYFNAVLYAIGELRHELIRSPDRETPQLIASNNKLMPWFKDCIGALDGIHIQATVPAEHATAFQGPKPYPTQNVLAAVDFDLKFTYVLAGWEGSAFDETILGNALERPNGLRVPEGCLRAGKAREHLLICNPAHLQSSLDCYYV